MILNLTIAIATIKNSKDIDSVTALSKISMNSTDIL